jgi:septal ring factor EnvC (AmiA/AmiB activator)
MLFRFGTIVLLAALAASSARITRAQTPNQDTATIEALLSEVRQLRRTVEKMLSVGPRMQVILQRAQLQEQKVSRLSQQLDEVRKQIAEETAHQSAMAERLANLDQDISAETDARRHGELEEARKELKMAAGRGPDQRLGARESELANSLATEQAVLNELNEKLDALERQLEASPAADGQVPRPR